MAVARYWVTETSYPTSDEVIADATAAGADIIVHGVPLTLTDVIPAGHVGYFEVDTPDPPEFPPLDQAGALATLLVVEGVLPLQDAALSVGATPEHLVHEAQAWAAVAIAETN